MSNPCSHPPSRPYLHQPSHLQAEAAVTVNNFRRLRELELRVLWPSSFHDALLSSITSTELQKIIFPSKYTHTWAKFPQRMSPLALIDECLCGLVDQLCATGYHHTLEAELRLMMIGGDPGQYDFTIFLPAFREKGVATIIDAGHGDRVLHSSTHNR